MKIAIVGAGNVGGALAKNWSRKGHEVFIGSKEPERSAAQFRSDQKNLRVQSVGQAVASSEVILVALPIPAVVSVAKDLGDLSGKVVIDATNSVFGKPEPYANGFEAFQALTKAEVVKYFNSTGFENMADPVYRGEGIDMFMAGDSVRAKRVAEQLSLDAGFAHCYDFGGADKVELLEQFAMSWINLATIQKQGRNIAFKVLRR